MRKTADRQRCSVTWISPALALCVFLCGASSASADLIKLNSGGEVRGKIVKGQTTRESVTLETLSGTIITVARADIQFLSMRSLAVEEYESRLRKQSNTAEAHWEMADWCRQKGLIKQREVHLRQVLQLDQQHEGAHLALGHVRQKQGWVSRDEMMTSQGYVKHKGKYITAQEYDLIGKTEAERQEERAWFHKVKLWSAWVHSPLGGTVSKQQEGWASLEGIKDPNATPAVARFLGESEHRELRLLAVKVLSQVGGKKPVPRIVQLSLKDDDQEVRRRALDGLSEEQYAAAMPLYLRHLKHEFNPVVCRAGAALGVVGNDKAVPPLIDALITSHSYQVRVPGSSQPNYSFTTNGGFAGGASLPPNIEAGLRAGQYPNGVIVLDGAPGTELSKTRVITVTIDQQNAEVLNALEKLTGKNFGYDQRTWHLWWAAEKHQGTKGPLKS